MPNHREISRDSTAGRVLAMMQLCASDGTRWPGAAIAANLLGVEASAVTSAVSRLMHARRIISLGKMVEPPYANIYGLPDGSKTGGTLATKGNTKREITPREERAQGKVYIPCQRCKKQFWSRDKVKNKICRECKDTDEYRSGVNHIY